MNGGHTAWPAADRRLESGLSPANRYRVRPFASTNALPTGVCRTEIAEPAGRVAVFLVAPLVAVITATIAMMVTIMMGNASLLRVMMYSLRVAAARAT